LIQTHENEKERFLPSSQPAFINSACRPWYGIFPLASLGYLSGCAPSQLLHTCSLEEQGSLERVLDFTARTQNISVIKILLLLNPKHSSY